MDADQERSGSGAPVYRHQPREGIADLSVGDPATIDAVSAHVERTLGPIESVFHEELSPHVHVDVLSVGPADDRPFRTLVSCGMSERPMPGAPDADTRRCELTVCLPVDWPLDTASWEDERNYWPVRLLKMLARVPHEYETWLWEGHTVPNGDPPEPYADGTELCGAILAPPILMPEEFLMLEREGHDRVTFLSVLPLHADEMQLKLDKGSDALYARLEAARVDTLIDPQRPSVVGKRRRRFGLF